MGNMYVTLKFEGDSNGLSFEEFSQVVRSHFEEVEVNPGSRVAGVGVGDASPDFITTKEKS